MQYGTRTFTYITTQVFQHERLTCVHSQRGPRASRRAHLHVRHTHPGSNRRDVDELQRVQVRLPYRDAGAVQLRQGVQVNAGGG